MSFSNYMRLVYFWTVTSFLSTVLMAYYWSGISSSTYYYNWMAALVSVTSSLGFHCIPTQYILGPAVSEGDRQVSVEYPPTKWLCYFGILTSTSWFLGTHLVTLSAETVFLATFTCIISLFTATYVCFHWCDSDVDCLIFVEMPIKQLTNCLLGISVIGVLTWYFAGAGHPVFQLAYQTHTYLYLALYCVYLGYHTAIAANAYRQGRPDFLSCSLNVYMDLVHLLIKVLVILKEERERRRTTHR